jgi:hypothetical protein
MRDTFNCCLGIANVPINSDLNKETQHPSLLCCLGIADVLSILIQREKCHVNYYLLAGNANVPPNSDSKTDRQG